MSASRIETSGTPPEVSLSRRAAWCAPQPIAYLMRQAVEHPEIVSLAAGLVDQQSLPVAEVQEAVGHLLADPLHARRALQYGTALGHSPLREQVVEQFGQYEAIDPSTVGVCPERVLMTTGSQQLLSLVSNALLDPGDIVLVSSPTYFVYLGTLGNLGARAIGIPMDEGGMRMDALQERLRELDAAGELSRVKLIYVVSYYQNPTGLSLAAQRRAQLVRIAQRWSRRQRIFVLEDAAYRELHYAGPKLPSVRRHDAEGETVIFAHTFSKSFSPGLRVGYGLLPSCLSEAVVSQKSNDDFGSANFNQHLISTLILRGLYDRHVEELVKNYRRKLDVMLQAAEEHFSRFSGVGWVRPQGGLYVWMTMPEGIDTGRDSELFARAIAEGVLYVPGEYGFPPEPCAPRRNTIRLSFGVQTEAGLAEGMRRLASAVAHVLS